MTEYKRLKLNPDIIGWGESNQLDIVKKASEKLAEKIVENQEKLIWGRLNAIGVFELDMNARFKPLIKEVDHKQVERWYYNDGTTLGRLLITFYPPDIEITTGETHSAIATTKYL